MVELPAAYLTNVPVTVTQPNGQVLNLLASGDEYYNWLHDQKGFTIMQDPGNGYYVYALKVKGDLVPSSLLPGEGVDPEVFGYERQVLADPERRSAPEDIFPSPSEVVNAPHSGTLNNIVIFIRFSDESEFTDNISSYNSLFNTETAGANSMRNYFYEVSYNALTIPSTFYPTPGATVISYQDTQARDYYRPYDATTNPIGYTSYSDRTWREHNLLKRAVDYVNGLGQFPPGSSIDSDGDGYVDNVCFIVSGSPGAWSSLLWPHRWSLYSVTAYINGKRVYDYNFQLQSTTLSWGVGVLSHEMFHSLGSPDLYHYTSNGITPVGGWDVMGSSSNPPEHMLMHMKWKYGEWLTAIPQITTSGTYTLNPSIFATNSCYKIASPYSATQYFMVEYRKRVSTFENSIPGEGLIVYRINTAAVGNASGPPDEVYIYRPDGTNYVNGIINQANFSSNSGRTAINDSTNPSSFLANDSAGGLDISNVTAVDATISFTVGFIGGYTIGGTITVGGSPLAGVMLSGLPGNPITNGSGVYSASVNIGWSGTVTPILAGYNFTPVQSTYSNVNSNQTTNYTAQALPPVQVSSPNGSEIWQQGTTHAITWTSYALANVKIEYSANNGGAWTTVIASTPAASGSYSWIVPSDPSTNCLVRISDAANAATNDVSDGVFTISETAPSFFNSPADQLFLPEVIWAPASGGGTWISEVQVTDISGGSQVSVYYNAASGRRGPFLLWDNSSGGALSSVKYTNLLQTIDGLDSETFTYYGTVGAVEFITQDGSHLLQAAARTLNGNYAKTFPAFSLHDSNIADTSRVMIIPNLTNNSAYRSTCGFFNPTGDALTVELQLRDAANNQIGSTISKTLSGYEFSAFSPFNEAGVSYPANSYDNVILQIEPVSGSGRVFCFGASANNATNDPAAHLAVQNGSGHDNGASNLQILPEAIWAPATGGGTWLSEVQIVDVSGGSTVSVYFDYGGGSRRGPFVLWTGSVAGAKVKYANILQQLGTIDTGFTYYGRVGTLEFQTQDGTHNIQVTARTLNGNYSKTYPGLNLVDAETADISREMLIQNYTNNSSYRSTCGFFNPTADAVTVEFTLLNSSGAQIGAPFSKTLAGHDFQAFNPFIQAGVPYPGNAYDNVILRVRPTTGDGQVVCFGASANNASNDPAAHVAVQGQ
ncbi:MAG: M6 family metalloprotease domain-containing protein [Candidatus Aminicenantes bacterium]|nr:M6 family metalloprotease domain-containing protein [Candidatus Aminicenantes bacterium]